MDINLNFSFGISIICFLLTIITFLTEIREFLIMYRKIIFIAIDLFSFGSLKKATILLFISGTNFGLVFYFHPFVFRELNVIECYSSFCVITAIFFGAMYLCNEVGDNIKLISFVIIVLINIFFLLNCVYFLLTITFKRKWERCSMVIECF